MRTDKEGGPRRFPFTSSPHHLISPIASSVALTVPVPPGIIPAVRGRSTAGQQPLELRIGVRIPAPEFYTGSSILPAGRIALSIPHLYLREVPSLPYGEGC